MADSTHGAYYTTHARVSYGFSDCVLRHPSHTVGVLGGLRSANATDGGNADMFNTFSGSKSEYSNEFDDFDDDE